MKNKLLGALLFALAFLLFLALPINAYKTPNITNSSGQNSTGPLYPSPITEGYLVDAPWRVDASQAQIPILAMDIFCSPKISQILVLDHNNGDAVVASTNWPAPKSCFDNSANNFGTNFFYELLVDKNLFVGNPASIKIRFVLDWWPDNEEGPISVYKSPYDLPTLPNWLPGDLNYHTVYSWNVHDFGAPIVFTRNPAKTMGLKWIAVNDFSFALREITDPIRQNKPNNWPDVVRESNSYTDSSFVFIPGEEVSTNDGTGDRYRHYLAHGISQFIYGDEFEANLGFAGSTPSQVVDLVNSQLGAVGYIAHPYMGYTIADDPFRQPWKEQDYPLNFTGMEFWNYESTNGDPTEFNLGYQKWQQLLDQGRHVYISGGSGAKGDFNIYLGKVKTYVYPYRFSQQGILDALKYGSSFITDGPLAVFGISGNRLGETVQNLSGKNPTLDIQWASTPEFGQVTKIEIWRRNQIADTVYPYSLSGAQNWTDSVPVTYENYYRLVAYTDLGHMAYTNPIWVLPDTKPPADITNLNESATGLDWILWNWSNPSDADFNHTEIWLNRTFYANMTSNSVNVSGLMNGTIYEIELRPVDNLGNIGNWANDSAKTKMPPDAMPPLVSVFTNSTSVEAGSSVRFSANASDNIAVASIALFIDNMPRAWGSCSGIGTNNASCYTDLIGTNLGTHTFYATASDGTNIARDPLFGIKNVTVVDTTPPIVRVWANNTYMQTGAAFRISSTATDNFNISTFGLVFDNISMAWASCSIVSTKNISCWKDMVAANAGTHEFYARAFDGINMGKDPSIGAKYIFVFQNGVPPADIKNLNETSAGTNWIMWSWSNPSDLDFNHTEVWLNRTFLANISNNSYNVTGIANSTAYEIELRPVDNFFNIGNWTNDTARTLLPPPIILAREVCGNNLGYSQGDTWQTNWNKSRNSSDPCNWYAKSHIHDLNTTIGQTAAIYVEFMPGYYEGCVSPVLISVSPDNANWALIGNITASSHDTDGNPAYPQFWASRNFTIVNVSQAFRFVNVSIPNCYNDWSKVIIYDTVAAPLSMKPSIQSTFFFALPGTQDIIIKPPSADSGSGGNGGSGGGESSSSSGGGISTTPLQVQKIKNAETVQPPLATSNAPTPPTAEISSVQIQASSNHGNSVAASAPTFLAVSGIKKISLPVVLIIVLALFAILAIGHRKRITQTF